MLHLIYASIDHVPLPEPKSATCAGCGAPKTPGERCWTCGDYRDVDEEKKP